MNATITALIAEDEPLLAATLRRRLNEAWPELDILAEVGDGISATALALQQLPTILFLDIRMPGRTGLDAAQAIADDWPTGVTAPLIVFVTAFEEYALEAFERAAIDYVQKPVTTDRIARTVARLQARLAERQPIADNNVGELAALIERLGRVTAGDAPQGADMLETLHLGIGNTVRIVRIEDVLFFEAADKYTRVVTADGEGLVRIALRDLLARLPDKQFQQVHRSFVVQRRAIVAATRDDLGHTDLQLRGTQATVPVSRAFSHLFRPM